MFEGPLSSFSRELIDRSSNSRESVKSNNNLFSLSDHEEDSCFLKNKISHSDIKKIDLNELLLNDSDQSFLIRVSGDSMENAGIRSGDMLLVRKTNRCEDGTIVVAEINGSLLVKRLQISDSGIYLRPENQKYETIKVKRGDNFKIWGKVLNVLKDLTA